jgi:hypothetical protein
MPALFWFADTIGLLRLTRRLPKSGSCQLSSLACTQSSDNQESGGRAPRSHVHGYCNNKIVHDPSRRQRGNSIAADEVTSL